MIRIIKETLLALFGFFFWTKVLHIFIYWDKYFGGPFIFDPEGGWIRDIIVWIISMRIDNYFGINFFTPVSSWVTGALLYVPLYALAFWGLKLLFGIKYLDSYIGFSIYLSITAFFFAMYYYHVFDSMEFFYMLSMPETSSTFIKSYVWVGMGLGIWFASEGRHD